MIKLNDIVVCGVSHSNMFWNKSGLECVDVIVSIDYNVDIDSVNLNDYDLSCENISEKSLKYEFGSYMVVVLNQEQLDNIENMSYKDLRYIIQSDVTPDIEEAGNKVSDKELEKAYGFVKEHVKSEDFKACYNRNKIFYQKVILFDMN